MNNKTQDKCSQKMLYQVHGQKISEEICGLQTRLTAVLLTYAWGIVKRITSKTDKVWQ